MASSGSSMRPRYHLAVTADALVAWFRAHRRALPWRAEPRDPYRVLVSELMLQQTQVDRVVPCFLAFVARFPDLETLAAAGEDDVVTAWSGLGYYRRARQLHRLACEVVAAGGSLPFRAAELARLPGVGDYTAAAVASLAFGEAVPVLDGNVLRVGARVLGLTDDPRAAAGRVVILAWVRSLLDGCHPGEVNEALMELGATLCTPAAPRCLLCPVKGPCVARAGGRQDQIPPPRPSRAAEDLRWVAALVVDPEGRWLLSRVAEGPILRGLWLPPFAPLVDGESPEGAARRLVAAAHPGEGHQLGAVRHAITYRRITVEPVRFDVAAATLDEPGVRWLPPSSTSFPTSTLLLKLVRTATE